VKELLDAIRTSPSQEEAKAYWDELQEYAWTEFLPITKPGTFSSIYAVSDKVEGFTVGQMGAMLWNTKVKNRNIMAKWRIYLENEKDSLGFKPSYLPSI